MYRESLKAAVTVHGLVGWTAIHEQQRGMALGRQKGKAIQQMRATVGEVYATLNRIQAMVLMGKCQGSC